MPDKEPTPDAARKPRPVTPELRARVKQLHAEGLGRNAIARTLEVAAATVSKIARQARPPLEFDREATRIALEARLVDLGAIREQLARKFLLIADETLDRFDAPVKIGAFGGSDNVWNEHLLDEPTIADQKTLVQTAQIAARQGFELLNVGVAGEHGALTARGVVLELRDALDRGMQDVDVDPTTTPEQPAGT